MQTELAKRRKAVRSVRPSGAHCGLTPGVQPCTPRPLAPVPCALGLGRASFGPGFVSVIPRLALGCQSGSLLAPLLPPVVASQFNFALMHWRSLRFIWRSAAPLSLRSFPPPLGLLRRLRPFADALSRAAYFCGRGCARTGTFVLTGVRSAPALTNAFKRAGRDGLRPPARPSLRATATRPAMLPPSLAARLGSSSASLTASPARSGV